MNYRRLWITTVGVFLIAVHCSQSMRAEERTYRPGSSYPWYNSLQKGNPNHRPQRIPQYKGSQQNQGSQRHHASTRSAPYGSWNSRYQTEPTVTRWGQTRSGRAPLSRGTLYSAPNYAITTPWAVPNIRTDPYPKSDRPSHKPFAGARPAPTAIDRYWPYLFEARQDPKTGLIHWRLP